MSDTIRSLRNIQYRQRLSAFARITAAAAAMIIASCSRQPPPPPAPAPKPALQTKDISAATSPESSASREERIAAIASDKFNLYQRKVKVADFPRAEAALRDLRAVFDLESGYKNFWDQRIPASKRRVLTLMSLCELCKDGLCTTCKGKSKCNVCSGSGKCGNCDGDPVRRVECRACICSDCSGTGKCRTCSGFRNSQCAVCSGNGTFSATTSTECRRCGGTGFTQGLRGAGGVASRIKCLTCRGTGQVPQKILTQCTTCEGKGRIPCAACKGAGRCPTCGGSGRSKSCSICEGKTYTIHTCPQCQGDGKCRNCEGTGNCTTCHGTGKCFECNGGVVTLYNFPVSSEWLSFSEGHILYDSMLRKIVDKKDDSGSRSVTHKDLNLFITVSPEQIVYIATQPSFDTVAEIMIK